MKKEKKGSGVFALQSGAGVKHWGHLANEQKREPEWEAIEKEGYERIHVVGLGRARPVLCPPLANPPGPMVR
jgi:hypothetical protein